MTRSLRLRAFLIMWPLSMAAAIGVAWSFARWVELEFQASVTSSAAAAEGHERLARQIEGYLAESASAGSMPTGSGLDARLRTLGFSGVAVVLDENHGVALATDSGLRLVEAPESTGGLAGFLVERDEGRVRVAERADVTGWALGIGSGFGAVYFIRDAMAEPDSIDAEVRADLRRTLLGAVLFAGLAAALGSLFLAGPLVGQVGRLATAAAAVERGDLDVRVPVGRTDEVGRLERSFNSMAASLEQAEAMKRRLVTDAAHELRTPLTNMVGLVEAMQDGVRERDDETLGLLRREAGLLVTLVDDLQELSLAESGQLRLSIETVDLREVARAAVEGRRAAADPRTWTAPSADRGPLVRADPRRLAQVLGNLLRNAVEHTRPGDQITVEVERGGGRGIVRVRDTGAGLPEEALPLIWERFYRVDPSRDRASGGMGLGLTIARELVHAMDGTIAVESREGRGTVFTVALPLA